MHMHADRKALLERIASFEDALAKARKYLDSGANAHWQGFRPLFSDKRKDGKSLPPHKDWVKNVFIPRYEKALVKAERRLDSMERNPSD